MSSVPSSSNSSVSVHDFHRGHDWIWSFPTSGKQSARNIMIFSTSIFGVPHVLSLQILLCCGVRQNDFCTKLKICLPNCIRPGYITKIPKPCMNVGFYLLKENKELQLIE